MKTFIICLLFLSVIILSFIILKNSKEKENYKEEIRREIYDKEKSLIEKRVNYDEKDLISKINNLEEERRKIEEQISLKENFNNSLKKIREEELDRVMAIEKEKRIQQLNNEVENTRAAEQQKIVEELKLFSFQYSEQKDKMTNELEALQEKIEDFHLKQLNINEAIRREKEIQENEVFYKIDISEAARNDIAILEEIRPKLTNREALSKLEWDVFIQRPVLELIKRVTGGRDISGIYKITYLKTGEAYIGKTTNIKTRWQNHIKTTIGLEGAAKATLHTRMAKDGFWNYSFEILEEVPKEKLTEREKYYIKLYNTTSQLNMREG